MRTLLAAFAVLLPLVLQDPTAPPPDDGRAGTVLDRQGLATVQPAGRSRWTPLSREDVLVPGDRIRTGIRGANAVEIALGGDGGGTLLVGPGTRLELGRRDVHVLRGECEVAPGDAEVRVRGPGGFDRSVDARTVVRAGDRATTVLDEDPRWLSGYRNSTTAEWMGSLVANVDGRDVPLAIDRHLVDVVIRDQVAETTIDQVYRNGSDQELEGVFTFPLPPDASVSGFAMWVGGEMIEADIVERSRARAIYEELKARKKDPGLLEWSGGNLFTARVWPIPARGQKRVRIRYTQVLPLEGKAFRYRTALRSEATRQHPVRDLRVTVRIASARGLASVTCPSHEVTADVGAHAATLSWDAEEISPDRDLEVRVELAAPEPVTVVDHVRDGQGYFMVLLTPPGESAGWERETVPEGDPVELCIVADTSGSMDLRARTGQRDLVAALLATLGAEDRFRLLAADREAVWFREGKASPDAAEEALAFLDERASLGWSDLDLAFRTAFEACGDGAVVVYVGDGMVTTGDADAQAFAIRLANLADGRDVTCHAVTTSNAFDVVALDAIARIGPGSRRELGDPSTTALALLTDALGPSLKDARVSFEGLRTARVYPEVQPNIPVGHQRSVIGRFLATGAPQEGQVVVEGTLRGEPVRWRRDVTFGTGGETESFLPRMWARRHADALLAEGPSPAAREEVVALSAEFGFMTPLTSFLVLEDDADRERYGITRRVRMSDGERFFAEAREQARKEQLRQALQAARAWRLEMRVQALREIAGLGRDLYGWPVAMGYGEQHFAPGLLSARLRTQGKSVPAAGYRGFDAGLEAGAPVANAAPDEVLDSLAFELEEPNAEMDFRDAEGLELLDKRGELRRGRRRSSEEFYAGRPMASRALGGAFRGAGDVVPPSRRRPDVSALAVFGFPELGLYVPEPPARPDPEWPQAALDALRAMDKRSELAERPAAIALDVRATDLHAPTGRVTGRSRTEALLVPGGWVLTSQLSRTAGRTTSWLLDGSRGVLSEPLGLARQRDADPAEVGRPPLSLPASATTDLVTVFRHHDARVVSEDGDEIVLELAAPRPSRTLQRLTIDRRRGLLIGSETIVDGKVERRVAIETVGDAGGITLPARVVTRDADGRTVRIETVTATSLDDTARDARLTDARSRIARAVVVGAEDPELDEAFETVHAGTPHLDAHLRVVAFLMELGRHEQALARFAPLAEFFEDLPGAQWIELRLLSGSRRGEELERRLGEAARSVAALGPGPDAIFRASLVRDGLGSRLGFHERLSLHDWLRPCFEGGEEDAEWRSRLERSIRAGLLQNAGYFESALALYLELADEAPADANALAAATAALERAQRFEDAIARLAAAFDRTDSWLDSELDRIGRMWTDILWRQQDLDGLTAVAERWTAAETGNATPFAISLSARLHAGDEAGARAMIDGIVARDLDLRHSKSDGAALRAAVQHLFGNGWNYRRRQLLPEDVPVLDRLARKLLDTPGGLDLAVQILSDERFRATDPGLALRGDLRADLTDPARVAAIDAERYAALAPVVVDTIELRPDAWAALRAAIAARYAQAPDRYGREVWASLFVASCDRRAEAERAIEFLRARLDRERDDESAPRIAADLLRRLVQRPWSAELEAELLALAPRAVDPYTTPDTIEYTHAGLSRWTADELDRMRREAALGPVAELEKLPRAQRRAKEKEARLAAREALAGVFASAADSAAPVRGPWLAIESICFAAETTDDRTVVVDRARMLLDTAAEKDAEDTLWRALRTRASLALAHVAVRRGATGDLVDSVLGVYRARATEHPKTLDWREQEIRLLLALDRSDDLLARLDDWIVPARIDRELRTVRARLLAEAGRFEEAASDLERVGDDAWLDAEDWEEVSQWHLVRGADAAYERAMAARLEAMTPYELQQLAWSSLGGDVPKLDETTARALRAMMRKADDPSGHVWAVRNLYDRTKDFRTLACFADGVIGHSPEGVYRLLQNAAGVIERVHEEATLIETAHAIDARSGDVTGTTDRRALALLDYLVHARATQVAQGGEDHRRNAASALQTACADLGAISRRERAPLATLLAQLPLIEGRALRDIRRDTMQTLLAAAEPGTDEHLTIADAFARTAWADGDRDLAIDTLVAAIAHRAGDSELVFRMYAPVDRLVGWWNDRGRFRVAERWLTELAEQQPSATTRRMIEDRIDGVHAAALKAGGATSLGSGVDLLHAAQARLLARLDTVPPSHVAEVVGRVAALHRAALPDLRNAATKSLLEFSTATLPSLQDRVATGQEDLTRVVADALTQVAGPAEGLRLYVRLCATEPSWYHRLGRDTWSRFDWTIGDLRPKAEPLPNDLRAELRALVLARLESDLAETGGNRASIWSRGHRHFWAALAADYLTTARRVLELHGESDAVVRYTAHYLNDGLSARRDAVRAMRMLEARDALTLNDRATLADWLLELREFEDAWAHVEVLLAERELVLDDRLRAIRALHGIDRQDDASAMALRTENDFEAADRFDEAAQSMLANACRMAQLHDLAARYYELAIRTRERTRPSGPDHLLADWYGKWARELAQLGRFDEGVEAAAAAIVRCGNGQSERQSATPALEDVLTDVPDLDGWIARYDAQVESTGVDAPLIRKALGSVLSTRKRRPVDGVEQYELAIALQPNDREAHDRVVAILDDLGRRAEAAGALERALRHDPSQLDWIESLATRLKALGSEAEAERAWTDLVEHAPHEADGHRRLAQHRESEKRFEAAVVQWRQVVRTRPDDPEGLLSLAQAQRHAGDEDGARATLERVLETSWHERFGDVKARAAALLRRG